MTTHDALLGRRIGRYEPLAILGRGGMARVYRALDHGTGREIALKVLLDPAMQHPEIGERFRREAHTLASLRHPHIVQVYDYGEHDGVTFIAEQLLAGPPLDRELADLRARGAHMPRERVQSVVDQLADALDYAHGRGVLHRDLKPANCIRDARGDLVLTDFGIAKALGGDGAGHTRTGTILGTPAYLSPEQARGESALGPPSDVYAVGVMLFEMLVGQVPFDAPQPMAVLMAHLQQPPPALQDLRPDLPASVAQVVQRTLAKDSSARFQSAGALARALRGAWSGARVPPPLAEPTIHSQATQAVPPPAPRPQPTAPRAAPTPPPPAATRQTTMQPAPPPPRAPRQTLDTPAGRRASSPLLPIVVALLVVGALIFGALQLLSAAGPTFDTPTAVVAEPTAEPVAEPTAEPSAEPTAEPPTEIPPEPPTEAPPPPTEAPPPPTPEPTSEPLPTIVVEPVPTTPQESQPGDFQAARAVVADMRTELDAAITAGQVDQRTAVRLLQGLDQLDKRLEDGNAKSARKAADDLRDDLRDSSDDGSLPEALAERLIDQLDRLELDED